MKGKTKRVLEDFVERTNQLKSPQFYEHVKNLSLSRTYRDQDDNLVTDFNLPDVTKRNAFILVFRLFTQQTEPISFHNLRNLNNDPDLSSAWKDGVSQACKTYFEYLNGYPARIGDLWGERPTRGKILNSVLHSIDHTKSQKHRQEFKRFASDEIRAVILMQEFANIVLNIYKLICNVSDLSENELRLQYPDIEFNDPIGW